MKPPRSVPGRRRSPDAIWAVSGLTLAAGLGVMWFSTRHQPRFDLEPEVPWWVLVPAFWAAEVIVVNFQFRREAISFSLSDLPVVVALFLSSPVGFVVAESVGRGLAVVIGPRRQPFIKVAFNVGLFVFSSNVTVLVFRAVAGGSGTGPRQWLAGAVAMTALAVITTVLIGVVIWLAEGTPPREIQRQMRIALAVVVTNTSVALAGVEIVTKDPLALALLAPLALVAYLSYRAYTAQRQEHGALERLYEGSRVLQRSIAVDDGIATALSLSRGMFRAERSELFLAEGPGGRSIHGVQGGDDRIEIEEGAGIALDAQPVLEWLSERGPVLLPRADDRRRSDPEVRALFERRGFRDGLAAPLYLRDAATGFLIVGNRPGTVGSFDPRDKPLFEALAAQTGVALENARLVGRLEESLAHLTAMGRVKDEFVAAVSHELRTPLTSIDGYVRTLMRTDARLSDDDQKECLDAIARQTSRLGRIIENLLVVTGLEMDAISVRTAPVPVDVAAHIAAEEVTSRAPERTLDVRIEQGTPALSTDGVMLRGILSNLVDNALKFSPPGTPVGFTARTDRDGVRLTIADHGGGIPADKAEEIFERFFQVDQSSTRAVGGMGLGLYICRRFAENLRGKVWLERSNGDGSEFALWLPAERAAVGGEDAAAPPVGSGR